MTITERAIEEARALPTHFDLTQAGLAREEAERDDELNDITRCRNGHAKVFGNVREDGRCNVCRDLPSALSQADRTEELGRWHAKAAQLIEGVTRLRSELAHAEETLFAHRQAKP